MLKYSLSTLVLCAACAFGQAPADNPLSGGNKFMYGIVKNNLVKAAEKMPEENYSFKPTPDVRSFGQVVGHVSDANYMFCSAVLGEKAPVSDIEKTKTTKADLVQAIGDSFRYCDKAYDEMTDATATEKVKFFGRDSAKLSILAFNNMHDDEHYGNMVTYLRLKSIVPPSSEPRKAAPPKKSDAGVVK
jgi:uncharacterized damage-inducible protein DinB